MAAIGLAAAVLLKRHGEDVVLGSFAADHVVDGTEAFERAVREGVVAARAGYVVTLGIAATGPSTAFGYVRSGAPLGLDDAPTASHVAGFTEKPDAETAAAYLATGEYRWNAGMFLVGARVLLDHLAAQLPALAAGLLEIAAAWDGPERGEVLERVWPGLTKIAIDHAIAEPVAAAGGVAVVPGDFGWDDVGDFDSLAQLLPGGTLGDGTDVLRLESPGALIVVGTERTVTVLGLPDAVVVDTPDAVLVTTREHAQAVKSAVDGWRAAGREDLL
jgi:mannose-1-phosphate guanylyltransferase